MSRGDDLSDVNWISYHVRNSQLTWRPEKADGPKRPNGWQESPELPTAIELLAQEPATLPYSFGQLSLSKRAHLEAQYQLCRVEGTEMLRRAIALYRDDPKSIDSPGHFVYTKVHVRGYLCAKVGAACRLSFSMERSPVKVDWGLSGRLKTETLIALSTREDGFKTICLVATVAARPVIGGLEPDFEAGEGKDTPPRIDIFWSRPEDAIIDPAKELVMVEAPNGYFEAVRHVMVGLQTAALFPSKLDRYIFEGSQALKVAQHLPTQQDVARPPLVENFDVSQQTAFERITTRELAIVQGPPGTGKTFTSVVALQSFVQTLAKSIDKPPIIVSAQTNHALDQLLSASMSVFGASIARLGGRTKDEAIDERTMYNLRHRSKLKPWDGPEQKAWRFVQERIKEKLGMCFPTNTIISAHKFYADGIITRDQYESLQNAADGLDKQDPMELWLDLHLVKDTTVVYSPLFPQDQFTPIDLTESDEGKNAYDDLDDEKERLKGDFVPIELHWTGSVRGGSNSGYHQAARHLNQYPDLYDIKPPRRGLVYRYLRQKLIEKVEGEFTALLKEYQNKCTALKIKRWEYNAKVLRHEGIQIIGCTTTGLTKYRGLLAAMKPKVLVIEEAAETREANIVSAFLPTIDQLVLVGDHQQLVPHVDVRELAHCNFNVSLFQRLIERGVPYTMLQVQRRMIPAIREVVQTFYPNLQDHAIVKQRPPVPGMGGINLWWFQHQWPDNRRASGSYSNMAEAMMIIGFARYLVHNGVQPSKITILTGYKAQLELLEKELYRTLGRRDALKGVNVRTIDGFQGQENDIILLSLVRSSLATPCAGFLGNENRAVVALSRARCGLFIFGNAENFLCSDPKSNQTWQKVFSVFRRQQCTEDKLPVTCKAHGHVTHITNFEDWELISGGGCRDRCNYQCEKGHRCASICHPVENHSRLVCRHPDCCRTATGREDQVRTEANVVKDPEATKLNQSYHTIDQLLDDDGRFSFRNRFGQLDEAQEHASSPRIEAAPTPALTKLDLVGAILRGGWDKNGINTNDHALHQSRLAGWEAGGGMFPVKIRETFVQTTTTPEGYRVMARNSTEQVHDKEDLISFDTSDSDARAFENSSSELGSCSTSESNCDLTDHGRLIDMDEPAVRDPEKMDEFSDLLS